MENYHILGRIGEGAHGIVYKAKRIQSGDLVALKKVPLRNLEDGFPTEVRTTFLIGSSLIIIYQLFKKDNLCKSSCFFRFQNCPCFGTLW